MEDFIFVLRNTLLAKTTPLEKIFYSKSN